MDDLNVLRSRFRGCMLGGAVGDALGMPTEVGPSRRRGQLIREACGVDWVQTYRDSPIPNYLQAGQYTDDTQQTICLAETLLASDGHFDTEFFIRKLTRAVERFHRGVGPSTKRVMGAIRNGALKALLRGEAASQSPTNGGAMRVAPVAMVYFWDPDRLMRITQAATRATHAHPTSVAGACVQALLVAAALREGSALDFGQLRDDVSQRIKDLDPELASLIHRSAVPIEDGMSCRVMDTVPAVARAFLVNSDDFSTGVLAQVNSDGDTDTKAAMLGQLIGGRSGIESIPPTWLDGLEDGHRGRTYLTLLADALLLLALRVRGDVSADSPTGESNGAAMLVTTDPTTRFAEREHMVTTNVCTCNAVTPVLFCRDGIFRCRVCRKTISRDALDVDEDTGAVIDAFATLEKAVVRFIDTSGMGLGYDVWHWQQRGEIASPLNSLGLDIRRAVAEQLPDRPLYYQLIAGNDPGLISPPPTPDLVPDCPGCHETTDVEVTAGYAEYVCERCRFVISYLSY